MRVPNYTNSTQLPVGFTDDLFEAVGLQENLQTKYTGGTVLHAYLGEKLTPENCKMILKRVFSKSKMPYLSLTPTFSICPDHGYFSGEHFKCPTCDGETEVYSRVCGYLRPYKQFNEAKQQEFRDRKMYKIKTDSPE